MIFVNFKWLIINGLLFCFDLDSSKHMQEAIDYVVEEKLKGREYDEIKPELLAEGFSEKEADLIIKAGDDLFLTVLIEGRQEKSGFSWDYRISGYGLIILGLGFSLLTYVGIIDMGGYYVIWYGPVLIGISTLLYKGKRKLREQRNSFNTPYNKWRQ
jgi:hypothetical protein